MFVCVCVCVYIYACAYVRVRGRVTRIRFTYHHLGSRRFRSAVLTATQRSRRAAHGRRWQAPALPHPPNLIVNLLAQLEDERLWCEAGDVTAWWWPLVPARPRSWSRALVGTPL